MAQQLELVARPGLQLQPGEGCSGPRFWIHRLVIWSEPGVVLREVTFRPGLNIVWSPDPADNTADDNERRGLGHTSGKTLLCRLLRYCLGEERFAPQGQRDSIATAFKDGMVGAEVFVDGTRWAIVRSIGFGRRHIAAPNSDLEELAAGSIDATGMAPFLEAVETRILTTDVAALMPGERVDRAWLIALAWLSRDQECRFNHVLHWRSPASDSASPARSLSGTQPLDALRTLLGAIAPKEYALRAEVGELSRQCEAARQEAGHLQWEAAQRIKRLADAFGMPQGEPGLGPLVVEVLRKAAMDALAHVARVDPATDVADFEALRTETEDARQQVERLGKELAESNARIPEIERIVNHIRSELPGLSFAVHESEHPVCPICEVPIDRALAEGCKLSHKLPNLDEIGQRREQRKKELDDESARLESERRRKADIPSEMRAARKRADELGQRLQAVERARDARTEAWYSARRRLDDVDRLAAAFSGQDKAKSTVAQLLETIEKKREQIAAHRDDGARTFQRATRVFDAIIRKLVGPDAEGRVTLDGKGLHLTIELRGERSSAAIDSLKVLAFDLTALCMSIEGATHLPAFLVHDSPREADLGLSAYHELFRLARSLEDMGAQPSFQYIVTTTTRPPDELSTEPWLRVTLQGAPAEERLLRCNL